MPTPDNKYIAVWEKLKKDGQVELAVPLRIQKKVLLGLKNLKHRDHVFKLEAEAKKVKHIMYSKKEQAKITIKLKEYADIFQHLIG